MSLRISWDLEDDLIDYGFVYDTLADLYHELNKVRNETVPELDTVPFERIMAGKRYMVAKDSYERVIIREEWDSTKRSLVTLIDKLDPAYVYIEGTYTGTNDNGFTRTQLDDTWSELAWVIPMGYETPIDIELKGMFLKQ